VWNILRKFRYPFLASKAETPSVIIKFIKRIQVGLQAQVRFIRTENGTEFTNLILQNFFDSIGITHQRSVAYTPQQNGVVERRNRTIVEAARTMLSSSNLPLNLLSEAVSTACFTQN
jgi:transposase InsO family protein